MALSKEKRDKLIAALRREPELPNSAFAIRYGINSHAVQRYRRNYGIPNVPREKLVEAFRRCKTPDRFSPPIYVGFVSWNDGE